MHGADIIQQIRESISGDEKAVILGYGSSNTEHFQIGMHWFDVLEVALRDTYGRFHQQINSGLCGDTTAGLLRRFDRQAARFEPRLTLITIGGNDSNPAKGITREGFEANLHELHRRFTSLGCAVVFQTYYSPDPERIENVEAFYDLMDRVRRVAAGTGAGLIDHLARWEAFRVEFRERYLFMMADGFHLNLHGNAVMGLDCARYFGAKPNPEPTGFWDRALRVQEEMDRLLPVQ